MQSNQNIAESVAIVDRLLPLVGGFATFADFFFDGIFADGYMTSKIFSSLEEVRRLKSRLVELRAQLVRM